MPLRRANLSGQRRHHVDLLVGAGRREAADGAERHAVEVAQLAISGVEWSQANLFVAPSLEAQALQTRLPAFHPCNTLLSEPPRRHAAPCPCGSSRGRR
jgi:hypothetical protein